MTKKPPTLPHVNVEAERAVLGALLIAGADGDHEVSDPLLALLVESDFYEARHALTFRAIKDLRAAGKAPDVVLVNDWLLNSGELATVTYPYLHELVNTCVSQFQGLAYAEIVLANSIARARILIANDLFIEKISDTEAVAQLEALGRRQDAASGGPFTLDALMREELAPLKEIVPGFIPVGLILLASKMKIGKSWLALSLAIAKASGGVVLGKPVEQGEVLYLALEDGKHRLQSRARKLLGNEPVPKGLTLATQWERFSLKAGGLAHVERWLRAHPNAHLVIVDVWGRVSPLRSKGGDAYAEDYAAMTALKALADRHKIALLVIHHTRKAAAEDVFDEINGTTGIGGACDTLLILQRPRDEERGALHVTGRDIEFEGKLALRFDKAMCVWSVMTAEEAQKADEEALGATRKKILLAVRALVRGTPKQVALKMGEPSRHNTIKNVMLDMASDGQLVSNGDGTYSEPQRAKPEPEKNDAYKQSSLGSLVVSEGEEAGNHADSDDAISDYSPDYRDDTSSLVVSPDASPDYLRLPGSLAVVSHNGHQSQAATVLAPTPDYQTTETTAFTVNVPVHARPLTVADVTRRLHHDSWNQYEKWMAALGIPSAEAHGLFIAPFTAEPFVQRWNREHTADVKGGAS